MAVVLAEPVEQAALETDLAVAHHDHDGEVRARSPEGTTPDLRRLEVAQLLFEDAAHNDPSHSDGARPGQRLGGGAGSADEDPAGGRDVDRTGAELLVRLRDGHHQVAVHRSADASHAGEEGAGDADLDGICADRSHLATDVTDHRLGIARAER